MKVLIATHGKMASGVKNMLSLFINTEDIETIDAYTDEHDYTKEIEEFCRVNGKDELSYIFTDMIGGSVNQKVMLINQNPNIKIISGFNIPLLMEVVLSKPQNEEEIANMIEQARQQMQLVKLKLPQEEDEDSFLD